jgi:hypothetical protein
VLYHPQYAQTAAFGKPAIIYLAAPKESQLLHLQKSSPYQQIQTYQHDARKSAFNMKNIEMTEKIMAAKASKELA